MKRLTIYSAVGLRGQNVFSDYVIRALEAHKRDSDKLIFVGDLRGNDYYDAIAAIADQIVPYFDPVWWTLVGYKVGLSAVGDGELESYDEIRFADATTYVVSSLPNVLDNPPLRSADFWSVGYFLGKGDPRIGDKIELHRVMTLSYFSVNKAVATSQAFRSFMQSKFHYDDFLDYRVRGEYGLHHALTQAGFSWASFLGAGEFRTVEPMLFEAPETVRFGCPLVLKNVFTLDPLIVDMQAIDCRATLTAIQATTDFDTSLIWASLLPHFPLRHLQSNMDDLRIIHASAAIPEKSEWNFGGKIAVVAHVYYIEAIEEFCELAKHIPCAFDFLISTTTEEHRQIILEKLAALDFGDNAEVRVMEQNRGRDMSALFITFRDLMLSRQYAWALRVHSKRTPQMSWQVGQSFKAHLTENLIHSKAFVSHLFDLLEKPESRDIGIVIPPVVHIGFGTLGHSWNGNQNALKELAQQLGITVPFDQDTPVAPYGTMYWFRPDAIRPIFEREWRWEEYNPEPFHIDGGLAHAQERLICYCAQHRGFRTLAVMSSEQAERNYLKLEYKMQKLASYFPVNDIRRQCELATRAVWNPHETKYSQFLRSLERIDRDFKRRNPMLWTRSRPVVLFFWGLLTFVEKRRISRSRRAIEVRV